MAEPLIRLAETRDAQALAELWLAIGGHLVDLNPRYFKVPESRGLAEWFAEDLGAPKTDNSATFVAELDGQVVGTVYVRLVAPVESVDRQVVLDVGLVRAEIDALAVAERYRRRGIGRLLMSAAEQWGRTRGAGQFGLDTYSQARSVSRSTRSWATCDGRFDSSSQPDRKIGGLANRHY